MAAFSGEKDLQDFLKFHLEREWGRRVEARVKLPGLHLPDIDLLVVGTPLLAVETKYVKRQRNVPYLGLDEALALLLYGVDRAYLLHAFDEHVETGELLELSQLLLSTVPIGYMVLGDEGRPVVLKEAPPNPLLGSPVARRNRALLTERLRGA